VDQDTSIHDRPTSGVGMADIWTQRVDPPLDPERIVGFNVEAKDAEIGSVEEATEARGIGRLIVDTTSLMTASKVLLPFGIIDHVDYDTATVLLDRGKEEIENAPEFDPELHRRDAGYYALVGEHDAG
jgi:hypothetical protein